MEAKCYRAIRAHRSAGPDASLFFGRHLRMPWQLFGRCFFALSSLVDSLPLSDT